MIKHFNPEDWHGRNDGAEAAHLRWHQVVQDYQKRFSEEKGGACLLGFAVDEGVERNKGRRGAAAGPKALRHAMGSLPVIRDMPLWDGGEIICIDHDLASAQELLAQHTAQILSQNCFPVVLGGGHEVAWGHFQGISRYLNAYHPHATLAVVNIDAHFDLRTPADEQLLSSGTSFWSMWQDCLGRGIDFHYTVLGLQRSGNTQALFDTAEEIGVRYVFAHQLQRQRIAEIIADLSQQVDFIYLTLCLDVLAAAYAPGVSAANPLGISPSQVLDIFDAVTSTGKLLAFDIAELNPRFDTDGHTAKLAAQLIFELLSSKNTGQQATV